MMNKRLRKLIQRISLVVTLFGAHFLEDPNDLSLKISQKLRSKGVSVHIKRLPSPSVRGEVLLNQGELSRSASEFELNGFCGRARSRKIRRQLAELEMPILESRPLRKNGSPQNVLFYLTNSKPFTHSGYTERSHHILSALKARGLNVCAVTRLGYPVVIGYFPFNSRLVLDGIEYRQILPAVFPRKKGDQIRLAVEMLVREAENFEAEILHTTTDFKNAIVVSRAAQILGIPWVYEARGELQKTWLSKREHAIRELASRSEYFVAAHKKELEAMKSSAALVHLSEVSKRDSVSRGISEKKIEIVPNAVSESEIGRCFSKSELREELGLPVHELVIGTVTSIVQYEGLDDLIRAVELMPNVHCIIVGDGETRPELETLANNLGLGGRVKFVGRKPANTVWKWYAALDVFVIPRKNQEVCRTVTPIKTLLAQANGVPVVASDLPALREITGEHAVYFPAEDPRKLATAVLDVLTSEADNIQKLTDAAREWVRLRSWDTNAKKLIALYRNHP